MWAALKKAVTGVTDSLGIEIPGLPVDLGSLGDSVASATQGVTDAAADSLDGLTAVGDQVAGAAAGVTENVPDISASTEVAAQVMPVVTEVLGAAPSR